jgi:hypothetical protein
MSDWRFVMFKTGSESVHLRGGFDRTLCGRNSELDERYRDYPKESLGRICGTCQVAFGIKPEIVVALLKRSKRRLPNHPWVQARIGVGLPTVTSRYGNRHDRVVHLATEGCIFKATQYDLWGLDPLVPGHRLCTHCWRDVDLRFWFKDPKNFQPKFEVPIILQQLAVLCRRDSVATLVELVERVSGQPVTPDQQALCEEFADRWGEHIEEVFAKGG